MQNNQKLRKQVLNMDKKLHSLGQWMFYNRHKEEKFHIWFVRIFALIIFLVMVLGGLSGCAKNKNDLEGTWLLNYSTDLDQKSNLETQFDTKNKIIKSEFSDWNNKDYVYDTEKKQLTVKDEDKYIYKIDSLTTKKIKLTLIRMNNDKKGSKYFSEQSITLTRKEQVS